MRVLSAAEAPCWKTYATGLLIGAMGWIGYLGVKACRRRWDTGRTLAAIATGAGVGLLLIMCLAVIGAGMRAGA